MARGKSAIPSVNAKLRGNKWAYSFEGVPVNGKRIQITKCGFATKEEALEAGNKKLIDYYRNGKKNDEKAEVGISASDFILRHWFPEMCKGKNWLESTQRGYLKMINNYVIPVIGRYPISSVTVPMLQDIVNDMYYSKGFSHVTVSNLHGLIISIFSYAYNEGYIKSFDSKHFFVPKKDEDEEKSKKSQKRDVIPKEVIDDIFRRFPEGSSAFLPMVIALYTGARLGEACALTFEECDFENDIIHIVRQMPDGIRETVCNPKYNSVRDVPMCRTLKGILLRAKKRSEENCTEWGENYCRTFLEKIPDKADYKNLHGFYRICFEGDPEKEVHFVNVNERGAPIYPAVMKHASRMIHGYSPNHKEKKVKGKPIYSDYNTHSLRHTYISILREKGVSEVLLSSLAGHKLKLSGDASETTAEYIHISADEKKQILDKVDEIYPYVFESNDENENCPPKKS